MPGRRRGGAGSASPSTSSGWPTSGPASVDVVVDEIGRRRRLMPWLARRRADRRDARDGAGGLPRLRLVAVARRPRAPTSARWIEKAEDDWGAWGTVYHDDDGRAARLDAVRAGAALPARGGAARPARRRTTPCSSRARTSSPEPRQWVEQSLFLAAIGEARDRGAKALEAFAYRYPEGESAYERFLVHRTVFPRDFLADFGFRTVRSAGRVELCRLELGGLQPVLEGPRAKVLRVVKEAFLPQPAPVPPRP